MKNKKAIILFLIITLILSSLCYYVRIKGGEQAEGMTAILMFCPTISALIVHMVYYRKEKILGINRCRLPYVAAAVIIPFLYLGLSYGIYWLLSKGSLSGQLYSNSIGMLLLLIPSSLITAAGEEIGWRGFLLPKMAETWNLNIAIFFSGLIWAIWHYPLMITGLYQTGTPLWYQLPVFTIEIFAITAILAVLRLRSKS
nr:CPBP family intramembrane metalloprotease [Butyrivibrio sp.]